MPVLYTLDLKALSKTKSQLEILEFILDLKIFNYLETSD